MNEEELNLNEILHAVDNAEILSIIFPILRKSLVIDNRFDDDTAPLVRIMPQANSGQERYRSIRRLRPHLPRPQNLTTVPWNRYVRSLQESSIIEHVRQRLEQAGYQEANTALTNAFSELQNLERKELASAILGDHYFTIWPQER